MRPTVLSGVTSEMPESTEEMVVTTLHRRGRDTPGQRDALRAWSPAYTADPSGVPKPSVSDCTPGCPHQTTTVLAPSGELTPLYQRHQLLHGIMLTRERLGTGTGTGLDLS
jgi:hypothetical protein